MLATAEPLSPDQFNLDTTESAREGEGLESQQLEKRGQSSGRVSDRVFIFLTHLPDLSVVHDVCLSACRFFRRKEPLIGDVEEGGEEEREGDERGEKREERREKREGEGTIEDNGGDEGVGESLRTGTNYQVQLQVVYR